MKTCSKCKEEKPESEFYPDKRRDSKLCSRCKRCGAVYSAEWRNRNPHKAKERYWGNRDFERERHLKRKYGITLSDYADMLSKQNGSCAICRAPEPENRTLDVDHDHATGRVRGLLCTSCNRMLGHSGDNAENLVRAAQYLVPKVAAQFVRAFTAASADPSPRA